MWLRITLWAMLLGSIVMGYLGYQTGSATTTIVGMALMIFIGFFLFFLVKMSLSAGLVFVKIVVMMVLVGAFVLMCFRGCQMLIDKGKQSAVALEERSRMITSDIQEISLWDKVKSFVGFERKKNSVLTPNNTDMNPVVEASLAPVSEIRGNAQRILSGNVFQMKGMFIKLYGVAAPVSNQKCLDKRSSEYNCGHASQQKLKQLLNGKLITCQVVTRYSEDKMVATCNTNGYDIGASMVSVGWAVADRRVTQAYVPYEKEARQKAVGLWEGKFVAPWRYEAPAIQNGGKKAGFLEGLFQ